MTRNPGNLQKTKSGQTVERMSSGRRRYVWPLVQWILFALVMLLIVSYLRRYWHEISSVQIRLDWPWGGLATALIMLSNVLQISLFQRFLRHNGLSFDFFSAWRTFCVQQIGKYIPGKVIGIAALSYTLKEAGLSAPHAFATVFVYNIVALLSSLLVGLLTLPAWATHTGPMVTAFFIATAAVGIPAVCTRTFWRLIDLGLLRFKRPPLPRYPSGTAMMQLTCGWILYWFILGTAMFAATRFLVDVPSRWLPLLVPAFGLACFISNISFLAPAGFGVREALLIAMIGSGGTNALGAVFAAASRIAMILNDIVMIGVAWLLKPKL